MIKADLPVGCVEDHLDVDAEIPGQKFVCLSFVSPERVLPQKDAYFRQQFWRYLKEQHDSIDFNLVSDLEDLYATFLDQCEQKLEEAFHEQNNFQTSIRGLKVRGVYSTKHEADTRARVLQKLDRHHHVFVAPVGYWLPWDPSADAVQDQVYQEEQLNELMKNYKVNELKRDEFYEQQKDERKKAALEENERRREAAKAAKEEDDGADDVQQAGNATTGGAAASDTFAAVEESTSHAELKAGFEKFKGGD